MRKFFSSKKLLENEETCRNIFLRNWADFFVWKKKKKKLQKGRRHFLLENNSSGIFRQENNSSEAEDHLKIFHQEIK